MRLRVPLLSALLPLAFLANAAPGAAAELVPGSTYNVFLADYDASTGFYLATSDTSITVGGPPVSFTLGGVNGTITDLETDLGGGRYNFLFTVLADNDLFPAEGLDQLFGAIGVGESDPLDLAAPFRLDSAILTFADAGGKTLFEEDFLGLVGQSDPFDGRFRDAGGLAAFSPVGGLNTQRITLSLTGNLIQAAVPEPASWMTMIAGFGLLGGVMRRRRRAISARQAA